MPIVDAIRMYPKNILLAMGARFAENGFFYIYATFDSGLCHAGAGHEQAGHIERRADRRGDRNLHDPGLRRALGPSRAPAGLYFRRRFLGADVVPAVHAARNQKPATRLDRDRARSGRRPRRHVRPAGELPLRTVRHQSALQRRVARLQSRVDLRRRAVAAHRHRTHDRLQAGDVADLRLYDRSGANHDRFGLFRDGNAARKPRPESGDADHRGVVARSERSKSATADFGADPARRRAPRNP